jgi:methylenetetrahydrofolate--tRNA-(uracil-5-)-methyltransferase
MITTHKPADVAIIGGGLAGTEAALQLADRGYQVRLYDLKPEKRSPAHHSGDLAEIVCSNSFGSMGEAASGLLKREMALLGCQLLGIATDCAVPAGQALAVDRDKFSALVTQRIQTHPNIDFIGNEITELPTDTRFTLLATGPMTTEPLVKAMGTLLNRGNLYFFDAAAPIVMKESINFEVAFFQDRYNKTLSEGDEASYINCPMNQSQYEAFYTFLTNAEKIPLKSFEEAEKASFFESCMPVEVIASRGVETLRYGPMKPVGLENPHKPDEKPYAVVQLRQDNAEGTLYNLVGFQTNLKWGEQKELLKLIPGLEAAEVVRYGVMHRNTYFHSPEVLLPTLQFKVMPNLMLAGQLTGTEGYTESIATGLVAALNIARQLEGEAPVALPRETMLGSLLHYITREEAVGKNFQPINSNWGILPELGFRVKVKKERAGHHKARALKAMQAFLPELTQPFAGKGATLPTTALKVFDDLDLPVLVEA